MDTGHAHNRGDRERSGLIFATQLGLSPLDATPSRQRPVELLSQFRGSDAIKRHLEQLLGSCQVVGVTQKRGVEAIAKEDVENLSSEAPFVFGTESRFESLRGAVEGCGKFGRIGRAEV
jgi:hypothetical protein